jgi:hypothetical protein
MTILKVMVPHSSIIPDPKALIFDHSREIFARIPISKYLMQVMDGRFVIFIEGELSADVEIGIKIEKVLELTEEEKIAFDRVGYTIKELDERGYQMKGEK